MLVFLNFLVSVSWIEKRENGCGIRDWHTPPWGKSQSYPRRTWWKACQIYNTSKTKFVTCVIWIIMYFPLNSSKYYLAIIDYYTKSCVHFSKHKNDNLETLARFYKRVENKKNLKINWIRSYRYDNMRILVFQNFARKLGICVSFLVLEHLNKIRSWREKTKPYKRRLGMHTHYLVTFGLKQSMSHVILNIGFIYIGF